MRHPTKITSEKANQKTMTYPRCSLHRENFLRVSWRPKERAPRARSLHALRRTPIGATRTYSSLDLSAFKEGSQASWARPVGGNPCNNGCLRSRSPVGLQHSGQLSAGAEKATPAVPLKSHAGRATAPSYATARSVCASGSRCRLRKQRRRRVRPASCSPAKWRCRGSG